MCKSHITLKKFLKLYLEVVFYRFGITLLFMLFGKVPFSWSGLQWQLFPLRVINNGFTAAFVYFWLFIPFLNVLVQNMTEKQHLQLIALMLVIYTVFPTLQPLLSTSTNMNYVSWFCVIYVIASFTRLYPKRFLDNTALWGVMSIVSILLAVGSVFFCIFCVPSLNRYFFVSDSNKPLAILVAFSTFQFFRTLSIPYSKVINAFGATTFGILLIHAHSSDMRNWLWNELLDNLGAYSLGKMLPVHVICSVLGVFLVCSVIDMLRIRFLEKPFFALYDRVCARIENRRSAGTQKKMCK